MGDARRGCAGRVTERSAGGCLIRSDLGPVVPRVAVAAVPAPEEAMGGVIEQGLRAGEDDVLGAGVGPAPRWRRAARVGGVRWRRRRGRRGRRRRGGSSRRRTG